MPEKVYKLYFCILIAGLFSSCSSSSEYYKLKGNSTPYKTFEEINKAIIRGDMETVYSYLSINQRRAITLEELKAAYQKYKDIWIDQAKNAKILHLAIDEKEGKASAIIDFGLGDRILATFVLEDGIWKEDAFLLFNRR